MPALTVTYLDKDQLDSALPLVRLVTPTLTSKTWRDHAAQVWASGGGILGVLAEDGFLHGLATFAPKKMLRLGTVLQVDDLITMELSRKAPVHQLLVDTLTDFARRLGCASVAVCMPTWTLEDDQQTAVGRAA